MAIASERLSRYKDLAWFLAKYARADFLNYAGIEPLGESDPSRKPEAEALARDLEALGPTFIKLGQILSTRGDLRRRPCSVAGQRRALPLRGR